MTGRELIRLQATLHGLIGAEAARRCDALIERVGLTQAADRRVGTYSGGMRRRLDLASALVHEPRVLFLDEPTTGLDPVSRKAIWEEVAALNARGHDRLPDHPVPRGGRPARQPGRDHRRRADRRRGHAGLAQGRGRQAASRDRARSTARPSAPSEICGDVRPHPAREGRQGCWSSSTRGAATSPRSSGRSTRPGSWSSRSSWSSRRSTTSSSPRPASTSKGDARGRACRSLRRRREPLATNARVVAALGARSVKQTFRRPQLVAPILIFPTLLLAVQTGGAGQRRRPPRLPRGRQLPRLHARRGDAAVVPAGRQHRRHRARGRPRDGLHRPAVRGADLALLDRPRPPRRAPPCSARRPRSGSSPSG